MTTNPGGPLLPAGSQIISPKPGASVRTGSTIPFQYSVQYVSGIYFPPTVDILLQREGENFAVEIANALPTDGDNVQNNVLSYNINLASFANADFVAGTYKLITIQHNTQKIAFREGHLQTRQVTGDQELKLILNLGPGPVVPPGDPQPLVNTVPLEPGPVIINQGDN